VPKGGELTQEQLPPCTASGTLFAEFVFTRWPNGHLEEPKYVWSDVYHTNVDYVVETHLQNLLSSNDQMDCSAENYEEFFPPTEALRDLAAWLPPWQVPGRLEKLSEKDLSIVLTEFLRIYECGLKEQENEYLGIPRLRREWAKAGNPPLTYPDLLKERLRRKQFIRQELLTARAALERTLTLLGGIGRLHPLILEFQCVQRASLDLRNVLGLVGEAMSCLNRIEDARGSLRDFSQKSPP
jgi:hypothetical protein